MNISRYKLKNQFLIRLYFMELKLHKSVHLYMPYKVRFFMRTLKANGIVFSCYQVSAPEFAHDYWIILSKSPINQILLDISSVLQVPIFNHPDKYFDKDAMPKYLYDIVKKLPQNLYQ